MTIERILQSERWGAPYGYKERTWSTAHEAEVIEAIQDLANEQSGTLAIEAGDDWLAVYTNEGQFSVGVQFGEEAFDLVGDATATGSAPFVLGGQLVPHPRRYLVSHEQAQAAALEFFRTGTVDVAGGAWDRQGPNSPWEEG
jgi:hypothetical protein